MKFEESPEKFRYIVVICPKCREHSQILETGKKTLRCQHCGALLQVRKLRVFYSSNELEKAVIARTKLQAEISGNEKSLKGTRFRNSGLKDSELKDSELKILPKSTFKPTTLKKDTFSVVLDLLETSGGKIKLESLQEKALENGISPEKLSKVLEKLQEAGKIYSPVLGEIKVVR